jgi:hypothetical protein
VTWTTRYSIAIRRKDGTEFLAATGHGLSHPIYERYKQARAFRDRLRGHRLNARIVRVWYAPPEIVIFPRKRRKA